MNVYVVSVEIQTQAYIAVPQHGSLILRARQLYS